MTWRDKRVVLIGDSHMQALGPRLRRLIPDQLGAVVQHVEANAGWSARAYLSRGVVPALVRGADVVIFEMGGNDASAGISPSAHAADVRALVAAAKPARVIWMSPGVTGTAALEGARQPLREAQKATVESSGDTWIDSRALTRTSDLRDDKVHFTPGGYEHWAQSLIPKLQAAGDKPAGEAQEDVAKWALPVGVGVAALFAVGAGIWAWRAGR